MGVLDGKVVLVTGAANGIGKECALLAAQEGASVVVNDLGGGVKGGDEGSAAPAEQVAQSIRQAGGQAVSNSDSVASKSGVAQMIAQALDTFKGLHAVISPAGILRDAMFHKMDDKDWDAVIDVHLNGTYNICRAAIGHFRERNEGSFVLFTSTSGLIGNIGQANYAAAKMGIAGLSRIVAMEGAAKNVRSNAIAPFAWTRMIETIPVKDEASARRVQRMKNAMRADQVAQLAVALASPACKEVSGQLFVARGNEIFLMSQPRPIHGIGKVEGWTPQTIAEHAMEAFKPSFVDLGASSSVFGWPPI
ncbi:MAG: SDR family oxidoreductase [Alphaproteobacteria bacterium]|nr:SDR family oxidoreductase [Alphaproteobacteria bacterium]MDE2109991.1 SDR family oxidoreductase [Alphaproteobacteria bacterium]MDE2495152.1 SDR family oxidoreductase [Alphaproteobacteria bacterium]